MRPLAPITEFELGDINNPLLRLARASSAAAAVASVVPSPPATAAAAASVSREEAYSGSVLSSPAPRSKTPSRTAALGGVSFALPPPAVPSIRESMRGSSSGSERSSTSSRRDIFSEFDSSPAAGGAGARAAEFSPPRKGSELSVFKIVRARSDGCCLFDSALKSLAELYKTETENPFLTQTVDQFRSGIVDYMRTRSEIYRARVITQLTHTTTEAQFGSIPEPVKSHLTSLRSRHPLTALGSAIEAYVNGPGWEYYLTALNLHDTWGGDTELGAIQEKYNLRIVLHYAARIARPPVTLGNTGDSIHLLFWGDHFDMLLPNPSPETPRSELFYPFSAEDFSDSSPSSTASKDPSKEDATSGGEALNIGRKISLSSRADSQRLGKNRFNAYVSSTNEQSLYVAIYENIIRHFAKHHKHPIHQLENSSDFQQKLADEIRAHPDYYRDDIVAEISKAIKSNRVSSQYAGEFKAALDALIREKSLSVLFSSDKELKARREVEDFLDKDEKINLAKYCRWIVSSGDGFSISALKAASQLYKVNFLSYQGEKLQLAIIGRTEWPTLYFQKNAKQYLQLVPETETAEELTLPFFSAEPRVEGFSPYEPRYLEKEAVVNTRSLLESKAGVILGRQLYEKALQSIRDRDLDTLKALVVDFYSQSQLERKVMVHDYKQRQGNLSAQKHLDLLVEKRHHLQLFLSEKAPKAGKFLSFAELRAQLHNQAHSIMQTTQEAFNHLTGERRWMDGSLVTAEQAVALFEDKLKKRWESFLTPLPCYRVHEYVPKRDKGYFDAERKKKIHRGPVASHADRAADVASTVDPKKLEESVEAEENRLKNELRACLDGIQLLRERLGGMPKPESRGVSDIQNTQEIENELLILNAVKEFLEKRMAITRGFLNPLDESSWKEVAGVKSPANTQDWSTPLTLEEIRVRFCHFLDTFEERACSDCTLELSKQNWLDYTTEGFILRSPEDKEAIVKKVTLFRETLSRRLEPLYNEMAAWAFGDNETTGEQRRVMARMALTELENEVRALNKVITENEDLEHEYLKSKLAETHAETLNRTQQRLKILLGEEACRKVYALNPSNPSELLKQSPYKEMTDVEILHSFYPDVSLGDLDFLLNKGISPDACNAEGESLLHILFSGNYDESTLATARYLLECAASVDIEDDSGESVGAVIKREKLHQDECRDAESKTKYDVACRALGLCTQAHLRSFHDYDYRLFVETFTSKHHHALIDYKATAESRAQSYWKSLIYAGKISNSRKLEREELVLGTDRIAVSPHEAFRLTSAMEDLIANAPKGFLTQLGLSRGGLLHTRSLEIIHDLVDSVAFYKAKMILDRRQSNYLTRIHKEAGSLKRWVSGRGDAAKIARLEAAREADRREAEAVREADRKVAEERFSALYTLLGGLGRAPAIAAAPASPAAVAAAPAAPDVPADAAATPGLRR